jgi:hypothetical protein
VLKRVEDDRGDSIPDKITFKKVFMHLSDWKIWAYGRLEFLVQDLGNTEGAIDFPGLMFMCSTMPAYAMAYFITIILKGMGWKTSAALLLVSYLCYGIITSLNIVPQSAPPYGPAVRMSCE